MPFYYFLAHAENTCLDGRPKCLSDQDCKYLETNRDCGFWRTKFDLPMCHVCYRSPYYEDTCKSCRKYNYYHILSKKVTLNSCS